MGAKTLHEIEASIEEMNLPDQVRLLQYLTPRIAGAVLRSEADSSASDVSEAWHRFRALGERLAATSVAGAPSLTDAVSQMRR